MNFTACYSVIVTVCFNLTLICAVEDAFVVALTFLLFPGS